MGKRDREVWIVLVAIFFVLSFVGIWLEYGHEYLENKYGSLYENSTNNYTAFYSRVQNTSG